MYQDESDNKVVFVTMSFALVLGLLLLSSIGVFDRVLDLSEAAQSSYRVRANSVFMQINDSLNVISDLSNLKSQRDEYKERLIEQNSEVVNLQEKIRELELVVAEEETEFDNAYSLKPASIIRFSEFESGVFFINRGRADGVDEKDVVVLNSYAVGEVVEVMQHTSKVNSVYVANQAIAVISQEGVRGIVNSNKGANLLVDKVLAGEKVEVGDKFTTYGIDGQYPPDLYVGEVVGVYETPSDSVFQVELTYELNISNLREVFILSYED